MSSAECGENRLSRYACPESCAFNPFAPDNYDALLATESRLDAMTMKRFARESDAAALALLNEIESAQRNESEHGVHAAAVWTFFFQRDANGRTFADRWRDAAYPELNNDERVLFAGKARMRVALLEVHRVLDAQTVEAVDLFDPVTSPMRLVDRSSAAQAVRFSTLLGWVYPLPHFWRMSGTAILMSDIAPFPAAQIIDACVAHLGGPRELDAKRRWLAENFVRIDDALTAVGHERRRRMFSQMDASFGVATYELVAPYAECHAALAVDPAIDRDEIHEDEREQGFREALVWFDLNGAADSTQRIAVPGRRVLGRILLSRKECRVEAVGGARLDDLRARFEARLGPRVRFARERRDNVGMQMSANEPAGDAKLIPPQLLEQPAEVEFSASRLPAPPAGTSKEEYGAMVLAEQRRHLADQPLPALEGATPRQAASDAALRPRLLELMKAQVRQLDRENLKTGRRDDINALLRELGLVEIDFPPPPLRPRLVEDEDEDANPPENFPTESIGSGPGRQLTAVESIARLEQSLVRFERAAEAIEELESAGATVLSDMDTLTATTLSEDDFGFLIPQILHVWFALVPRGMVPRLRCEPMTASFHSDLDRLTGEGVRSPDAVTRILESARQPHFFQLVLTGLMELANKSPKKRRPSPESLFIMAFALKALVNELDIALRG